MISKSMWLYAGFLSFIIQQLELTFDKSSIISFCSEYFEYISSTYRANLIQDDIDSIYVIKIYDVLFNNITFFFMTKNANRGHAC